MNKRTVKIDTEGWLGRSGGDRRTAREGVGRDMAEIVRHLSINSSARSGQVVAFAREILATMARAKRWRAIPIAFPLRSGRQRANDLVGSGLRSVAWESSPVEVLPAGWNSLRGRRSVSWRNGSRPHTLRSRRKSLAGAGAGVLARGAKGIQCSSPCCDLHRR